MGEFFLDSGKGSLTRITKKVTEILRLKLKKTPSNSVEKRNISDVYPFLRMMEELHRDTSKVPSC